jgi:hypothetical protein
MKRVVNAAIAVLTVATASGAISGAVGAGARVNTVDRVCAGLIKSRNAHSYPPDRQWVWEIPHGCVYTRDLPRPTGCSADPDLGCAAPPDVHIRFQRRDYVFHLTFRGVPAKATGIWNATGRRLLVTHDGRAPKRRERLFIEFDGTEFDGILQSGPSQGQADIGPGLRWSIVYTLDRKKGLCCPHADAGSPDTSPFDVAPERLTIATQ